ncbi:MAG: DUF1127 domain-containing protein [Proteobacteria bacterium]|nr:DUF1127 domain-containing protein [Pseudomonadota bacterium]MDA1022056.1 DUF1127 domain-containing protein [Pseudomonadota bacterium]
MSANIYEFKTEITRSDIDAGIRRGHELRSQFFTGLVLRAARAIAGWTRVKAPQRQLGQMSDHVLKDIGIQRDQLSGLVSAALRRDELSLSPTGNASAPAFWTGAARPDESVNENHNNARAA